MFNELKKKIIYLGLSVKKELTILFIINLLYVGLIITLVYFNVSFLIIIVSGTFLPLIDYLYISRYNSKIRYLKHLRNQEFISLLSYFEIFIANHNNVYKSFQLLLPYCSEWMYEKVENLLKEIDLDKSVAPFVGFSKDFSYLVIQNVMVSIYQMIDQGESELALVQFDYLFSSLTERLYSERIDTLQKGYETLNAFPLIGAGLITIMLTFSIMSILGDITNVI